MMCLIFIAYIDAHPLSTDKTIKTIETKPAIGLRNRSHVRDKPTQYPCNWFTWTATYRLSRGEIWNVIDFFPLCRRFPNRCQQRSPDIQSPVGSNVDGASFPECSPSSTSYSSTALGKTPPWRNGTAKLFNHVRCFGWLVRSKITLTPTAGRKMCQEKRFLNPFM